MIKCSQCNTLYAESAKLCLYCKIALPSVSSLEPNCFDFEFSQVRSEVEASQIKMQLLTKGVACAVIPVNDGFKVMISTDSRADAFREPKDNAILLGGVSSDRKKNTQGKLLTYLVLFILALFSFLFLRLKSEQQKPKEKIIYEGTVDPRIMPKESYAHPKNESKKQTKPSSQPLGSQPGKQPEAQNKSSTSN